MAATVTVTVSGDHATVEVDVDPARPLGELVARWAPTCSSHEALHLVLLSGDATMLLDPAETPAGLALGYGSVVRLVTVAEAMAALDVRPATGPPFLAPPPPAPTPYPAGVDGPPLPLLAAPASSTMTPSAPPVAVWTPAGPAAGVEVMPGRVGRARRLGGALRAAATRKAVFSPAAPYAKPATPGVAERYRNAMRATNRVHNLEMLVRSAWRGDCVVIAVVSPKGGVGKTTLTALLATLFAELRRDNVIALDANPDLGNLRAKLGLDGDVDAVDELASWLAQRPDATPAELTARLGCGPHGVRYIPTPRGDLARMINAADHELYSGLISRLRDYVGLVVVDCGTGLLDPPVRAALGDADQVVLVTDSSADTAEQVVETARYLPQGVPTWLAANKMPSSGSKVDLASVAAALPWLEGTVVIPERRLAENVVTPAFTWDNCPQVWAEPVRELAARLAVGWHSVAAHG